MQNTEIRFNSGIYAPETLVVQVIAAYVADKASWLKTCLINGAQDTEAGRVILRAVFRNTALPETTVGVDCDGVIEFFNTEVYEDEVVEYLVRDALPCADYTVCEAAKWMFEYTED